MKKLLPLLFVGTALAQSPPPACSSIPACDLVTQPDRTLCTAELQSKSAQGRWIAWWWKDATNNRWCGYSWVCITSKCNPPNALDILQTIRTQGISSAQSLFAVTPVVGSQDEYDFKSLAFQACQALAQNPPPNTTGAACSMAAPTPPTGGPMYRVPYPGRIYTYKSPTQLGDDTGRKSTQNALCKSLKTTIGNSVYWTLDGGSDTEVTYCVKVGG